MIRKDPTLLLLGLIASALLLTGCHRDSNKELNGEITWETVHAEKSYTDTLTAQIWQDTALAAPAYKVRLDIMSPSAKGSKAALADSLRTYLIRRHTLEGPDYTAGLSVDSYLDSVIAYGMEGYMQDLDRAKSLMRDDAESPTALLSFFTDELIKSDSLTYNRADLVSMKISQYAFNGGANGAASIQSGTYDLRNARPVTVDLLFADGSEDPVNQLLLKALMSDFGVDAVEALADKGVYFYEEAKMGENFYLSDEGVTFFFNPYDIAAHFVGPIELTLPYSDLSGYLKDEYYKRLTAQ